MQNVGKSVSLMGSVADCSSDVGGIGRAGTEECVDSLENMRIECLQCFVE